MAILDWLFRRGNPTNGWVRTLGLRLAVDLNVPAVNGVELGRPFAALEFLGRDEDAAAARNGSFRYYSLGLEIDCGDDHRMTGFSIVASDPEERHQSFCGAVTWLSSRIDLTQVRLPDLPGILGEWYWVDRDDEESIVFYEFLRYEMQIECDPEGRLARVLVTDEPLMASQAQRTAYGVTKPYPYPPGTSRGRWPQPK